MVLLVLALIWAVVLLSWLRSRTAGSFGDSIGSFRRHLHVLERTGPLTVLPANRMRGPSPIDAPAFAPVSLRPRISEPPPLPSLAARRAAGAGPAGYRSAGVRAGAPGPSPATLRRRHSQKRRRDLLLILVGLAALTLVLGFIPGLHALLYVQVVFDLLLIGYLALLVRIRNLNAERAAKVTYLPPVRAVPPGAVRQGTGRYAPPLAPVGAASASAAAGLEPDLLVGSAAN